LGHNAISAVERLVLGGEALNERPQIVGKQGHQEYRGAGTHLAAAATLARSVSGFGFVISLPLTDTVGVWPIPDVACGLLREPAAAQVDAACIRAQGEAAGRNIRAGRGGLAGAAQKIGAAVLGTGDLTDSVADRPASTR
jgi:hypothetical protein